MYTARTFDKQTLQYDPAADIDAIRVPSLWIYGGADTIIPVEASIAQIRAARSSPKPELTTLARAGHTFTVSDQSLPHLANGYPDVVVQWILARTKQVEAN